ncbi:MAG TPA: ABC transporter substrate-binding protein [Methylomirabilota bacterium]|nr:ABC transporter substrate-binding protein [Methylomirabilota bacterium]
MGWLRTLGRALAIVLALTTPISAQPVAGRSRDTLVVALVSHAPTLDPHMQYEWVGILVGINMFDSLLHRNARLQYEPSLAVSWKALNDTVWEFRLREGVKFHNGAVLTAEDVKYSFERVLDPLKRSPLHDNIRAIRTVRVMSPDTVHIVTDRPFPLLLERLVFFPIVPKQHVERVGDEAFGESATVGTGPWKLAEFKRGQHLRLEAFDGHWRGRPPFRVLTFRVIPEIATQVSELKKGGVDIVRNVPGALLADLRAHPQIRMSSAPILRTHYVQLDMRTEPFHKKAVRQAVNYAIDRDALVRKLPAGLGRVVPTVVHPAAFGYDPAVTPYSYDPGLARTLLTLAGYPNGVEITLHSAFVEGRPIFESIAQMLTAAGLKTTARAWDPDAAWTRFFQGEGRATHGYYGAWGYRSIFDADAVLQPLYHTGSDGWVGKWYTRVDGLDQLIDQARFTIDLDLRRRTYAQIQRVLKEESPSIFLFHEFDTLVTARTVEYAARGDQWLWLFDAKPNR